MRLIYVDEAGTAPKEPIRVVAGVLVDGDNEYRDVEQELARLVREHVPESIRPGFIIHATEIFSGGRKGAWQDIWPIEQRLDFLKEVACLAVIHDLPIALGVVKSGTYTQEYIDRSGRKLPKGLRLETMEHVIAFALCLERADYFLRDKLSGREIGYVVAEDAEGKRRALTTAAILFKYAPSIVPSHVQARTPFEDQFGIKPPDRKLEIKNIVEIPSFVQKHQSPMLQLADVAAFSLRRFLTGKRGGDDLVCALLGPREGPKFLVNENMQSQITAALLTPDRYASVAQRNHMSFAEERELVERLLNPQSDKNVADGQMSPESSRDAPDEVGDNQQT